MTRGNYLKGPTRGGYPGRLVSVVVATQTPPDILPRSAGYPLVFKSAHVHYTYRKNGRFAPARSITFGSPGEFWRWLESYAEKDTKTHVIAPIARDALVLLHGFERFDKLGSRWVGQGRGKKIAPPADGPVKAFGFRTCVLAGTPDIVDYSHVAGRFLWLSGSNYFRLSEGLIASSVGYQWRTRSEADDAAVFTPTDPGDRSAMWLAAMVSLAEWWGPLKAGGFPSTAPAGAWQFLRSRLPKKLLCTHDCPDTIRLEQLCCHGGRSSTWFFGDVRPRGRHSAPPDLGPGPSGWPALTGPIYLYDIRSTYPALMRDMDFPVKRTHYTSRIGVAELRDMLVNYHAVASVMLRTERAEYPHRRRGRVMFPVGRFRAHLTTPELIEAIDAGEVESVACAAFYLKGRPFVRAASELIDMRAEAKQRGRPGWALFVKLVSNSMTGKLAPRQYTWTPAPGRVMGEGWGYEYVLDADTGRAVKLMSRMGLVWERSTETTTRGTTAACYGVLQAYCRVMMRRLRESCPPRSIISQGTDGLWVTRAAKPALDLACSLGRGLAGSLQRERSVANARFLDSKHYWTDGVWTVAGVPSGAMEPRGTSYAYRARMNPISSAPDAPPVHVYEAERLALLACRPVDLIVGADGWGQPVRLPYLPGQSPADVAPPDDSIPW